MLSYHFRRSSIQYLCQNCHVSSLSSMKNSSSICSNSLDLNTKFRGVISFLNDRPIWAIPNGIFTRVVDTTLLKLINVPCAVSGLKYAIEASSETAPICVSNIRLKSRGCVNTPTVPVAGDGIEASSDVVASMRHFISISSNFPCLPILRFN